MVDVFISYSRADAAPVRQLADAVKRLGYSVWWDDELPPHLSYGDVISQKIADAKAAIVVWSPGAAASEWVRAEADLARNHKKLIQTSLDGRMPPMPFNQIQFAAIGDWRGEEDHPGWLKVKASLEALCGPPPQPTAATARGFAALPSTPPPAAPAPRAAARSKLLPALLGVVLLAAIGIGYLLLGRGANPPAPASSVNQAAPATAAAPAANPAPTAPPPTDQRFNQAATVEAAQAEVRSGPSAEGFVIARVSRGDLLTTYRQQGDWWQIRAPNGTVGYLARSDFRLMQVAANPAPAPPAAAPPAPRPTAAPAAPRPQAHPVSQVPPIEARPMNPGFPPRVMFPRRYCKGPGRGTPACRGMAGGF